ncbi:hypothetical protein [Caudoviricetes sp.]|nr:hypothetical protein [Caudoviricetes sp.]
MGLAETLDAVTAERAPRGEAKKRYVPFSQAEWLEMEVAYGKKIEPNRVKQLIQGIFSGKVECRPAKK